MAGVQFGAHAHKYSSQAYAVNMPTYEYKCRECGTTFEARRSMAEANAPINCPDGHVDAIRMLSVFASVNAGGSAKSAPAPAPRPAGGCGGGCACH